MIDVVLHEPEIPPNTGNAMRLCANAGARLHLIEPLGFTLETKALRRAGLDYRDLATVRVHASLDVCLADLIVPEAGDDGMSREQPRIVAMSTKGSLRHDQFDWLPGDVALFGPESRGLPDAVLADARLDAIVRLPMRAGNRSLNLSNAVAVTVFEAWRQNGWTGAAPGPADVRGRT